MNACGEWGGPGSNAGLSLSPQALPSIQIPVSPHIFTSISWATATSTLPPLSPVSPPCLSFHPFGMQDWAGSEGDLISFSFPALNIQNCGLGALMSPATPPLHPGTTREPGPCRPACPLTPGSLQVRSRSLSFSEPQPPTPMLKSHLIVASPPRVAISTR